MTGEWRILLNDIKLSKIGTALVFLASKNEYIPIIIFKIK